MVGTAEPYTTEVLEAVMVSVALVTVTAPATYVKV